MTKKKTDDTDVSYWIGVSVLVSVVVLIGTAITAVLIARRSPDESKEGDQ